ncbi:MAG: class I SAM-dependent methyltransferase [Dongiaceae bacterium]
MFNDVGELRDFYASSLGQVTRRILRQKILEIWPSLRGQRLLGLGYATPFLDAYKDACERRIALMPASQGVIPWPNTPLNSVALAYEYQLPFADFSLDRILIVHGLEGTSNPTAFLDEVWRTLTGDGRVLMVVPNRLGLWSRLERTPFGHGQPYSLQQLLRLLRDHYFTPLTTSRALFMPPMRSRLWLSSAKMWEKLGQNWLPGFAGALLIEARKEIYSTGGAKPTRKPAYLPIPGTYAGATTPQTM